MTFQINQIPSLFRPSALNLPQRFRHVVLHDLDTIAAREYTPWIDPVGFQDGVRVHEHRAMVLRHCADQSNIRRAQVRQVFDVQIEQADDDAERNIPPLMSRARISIKPIENKLNVVSSTTSCLLSCRLL